MMIAEILKELNMERIRPLAQKPGQQVLQVRRADGSEAVLRVYDEPVEVYRQLTGHDCPGLPQIFEIGEAEGLFFAVEEYIDGVSLQEMLDGGACMSPERTIALTCKICQADTFLHQKGFIHRDIKPEHVLLTADGRAVLIDLDASMRISHHKDTDTHLLGTAMYAAPEQFGLTRSDERTDVYALGILMNEMLTGVHPAVIRYQDGPLAEVIERSIRINPAERYQSAAQLEMALQTLCTTESVRESKRKKPAVMLAGLLLCIVIGLFVLRPPGGETEYLPLYGDKSHNYTLYCNSHEGSQSRSLYTETNTLVDQTWKVYADPNVGVIEEWVPEYEGWMFNSQSCDIGASGYIHAEKDGKHYAIPVLVLGEPMSAYSQIPSSEKLTEGYLQPAVCRELGDQEVVKLAYQPDEEVTVYLAAMEGFYDLQPESGSDLVTITCCQDVSSWENPVFAMTFRNPEGGDVILDIGSNHNTLTFYFWEKK